MARVHNFEGLNEILLEPGLLVMEHILKVQTNTAPFVSSFTTA